ncbi:MAG: hypothetical protein WEA80_02380 [Gemmatimonadaceae bacterium]
MPSDIASEPTWKPSMDFGNFNIFARYQFGLTNLSDDSTEDAKNRVIQIGGRFSFRGM